MAYSEAARLRSHPSVLKTSHFLAFRGRIRCGSSSSSGGSGIRCSGFGLRGSCGGGQGGLDAEGVGHGT